MLAIFQYSLNAILPILLEVALGYAVRQLGSWDDAFYARLNKLCFSLFLPLTLSYNLYNVSSPGDLNLGLAGFLVLTLPVSILIGAVCARLFVPDPRQKGAIVQAAFRSNVSVVGLTLAAGLGGDDAVAFASLISGVTVAAFNILAVVVLNIWSVKPERKIDPLSLLKGIAKNPLIIGICCGTLCVGIRYLEPWVDGAPVFTVKAQLPAVYTALTNLSKISSPLMLFCIGARLDFKATGGMLKQLMLGVLLRLLIVPALMFTAVLLLRNPLGLTAVEMPAVISVFATPCAVSGALMVKEIAGGDEQFAGQLVVWSCVGSIVTLFLFVSVFRAIGYL